MKTKGYDVCLITSGAGLLILGIWLTVSKVITTRAGVTGLDIVNSIIVFIAGVVPLGVALLRLVERKNDKPNLNVLKRLAKYWIIFATVSIALTVILNLAYMKC